MALGYCAGQHDHLVLTNLSDGRQHCCDDCANPEVTEPCQCDASEVRAPQFGTLAFDHPLRAQAK